MNVDRHCPVHAPAAPTVLDAWACPTECEHFRAELDLRIVEMTVSGHYFKMVRLGRGGRGTLMQEYRDHLPYGEPVLHDIFCEPKRPGFLKRIRMLYRARRR